MLIDWRDERVAKLRMQIGEIRVEERQGKSHERKKETQTSSNDHTYRLCKR